MQREHATNNSKIRTQADIIFDDIFRFTLYWTLIFYMPIFLLCGLYAFWNYASPPVPRKMGSSSDLRRSRAGEEESYLLSPVTPRVGGHDGGGSSSSPMDASRRNYTQSQSTTKAGGNSGSKPLMRAGERRSRVTFAIIVLLTFLSLGVAGAVIGSAITGFVTAALYKAGNFNMSTWIPFLLAVMQVVVGLLSVWPSIVEII
ncbi:hypothetical protein D9613_006623 [Agrocybe pediades]|uniref:Uncharacterized protein n=1 Tax=Agrocybe pediades TaxID=84607 RepID=A0A8H4QIB0_9AGAR|nr:hypothetical protein D9613_006623 [Agrocybe pediades]